MMAVPSLTAKAAVVAWPVGPRTPISTRRYPAASAASTVPSPPSAIGTCTVASPGRARSSPAATDAATWGAVSVPLNLSGAISTQPMLTCLAWGSNRGVRRYWDCVPGG